jgi:hypothetical protein
MNKWGKLDKVRNTCPFAITNTNPHKLTKNSARTSALRGWHVIAWALSCYCFLVAQESQYIHSLNFLPSRNLRITKTEGTAARSAFHYWFTGNRCDWARTLDTTFSSPFTYVFAHLNYDIVLNLEIHILFCLKFHINISFIQNLEVSISHTAVTTTIVNTFCEIMLK